MKEHSLSNFEIDDYYEKNSHYGGCYAKDVLPKSMNKDAYVFNLENNDQGGSHWTCAVKLKDCCIYFDSYGFIPPPDVIKFMKTSKKPCIYSSVQFQDLDSVLCGYYCIFMIDNLLRGVHFNDLMTLFSNNTKKNDQLIRNYFKHNKLVDRKGGLIRGAGILDTIRSIPSRIIDFFKGPRSDAPPVIRNALQNYGDQQITRLRVCRTPLNGMVEKILNIISSGEFNKQKQKLQYDQVFHLYLIIDLKNGKTFRIEKNATVDFAEYSGPVCGMLVPVTKTLTFSDLINKPAEKFGSTFWQYNSITNNCQVFVKNILDTAGLNSSELTTYVMQDAKAIFSTSPEYVKMFQNAVTDLGARGNILLQGKSIR